MYIENLRVDQFGQLRDAQADGLHHRLSVLGCSHESDRDSVRDFIHWMLFGNEAITFPAGIADIDPRDRHFGHVRGSTIASACGSMTVTTAGRRRQIQRAADSAYGRLTIDGHYDDSAHEFHSLFGRVTPREFDAVFAPLLCRDIHPDQLMAGIQSTRLDLAARHIPNERLRRLQDRHQQLRVELDRLPYHETLQQIAERRAYLLRRIDELSQAEQRRRQELDRQYNEVCQRSVELSHEVDRLRAEFQMRDDDANRRRAELEEAWRVAQQAKEAHLRQRREELDELDSRTNRWRGILNEVRSRLAEVKELRRRLPNIGTSDESQCLVSGLAEKLDRLRRDVGTWTDYSVSTAYGLHQYPVVSSPRSAGTYVRPALDELRNEVSRLCHTLQSHGSVKKERWLENEADYLQQCESLMSNWLVKLDEQLSVMRREVAQVERSGLVLVDGQHRPESTFSYIDARTYYDTRTTSTTWPYDILGYDQSGYDQTGFYRANVYEANPNYHSIPNYLGLVQATPHACDGYDVAHPETDARLRELIDSRNRVQGELSARQREFESLESQRDSMAALRREVHDHETQTIQRELSDLDARFRLAEQRSRLEREITQLIDQMSHERDVVRPSPVVEHASRWLSQLTGGRFDRIRIGNEFRGGSDWRSHASRTGTAIPTAVSHIEVDDARGVAVNLNQAGRELRSDTYLALCLALVAEYRRLGTELPMILSEPFVMVNQVHDRARAEVIRDFAAAGHQVIILTNQSIIRDLFRGIDHVYADLQPRPTYRPMAPPLPRVTEPPIVDEPVIDEPPLASVSEPELEDQVRFKRRAGSNPISFRPVARRERPVTPSHDEPIQARSISPVNSRPSLHARPVDPSSTHVTPIEEPIIERPSPTVVRHVVARDNAARDDVSREPIARSIAPISFSEEQHSLSLTSPIETTQVIDVEVAQWLRENGIENVREFLELVSSDLVKDLVDDNFASHPIRRWQEELALRCWVVGLVAEDATMLVNCGIVDAEQLAEMDSDELYDFLVRGLKSQSGSVYDSRRMESLRDRVHFWVRAARRSRTDWVRFRTRNFGKRAWSRPSRTRGAGSSSAGSSNPGSTDSESRSNSAGTSGSANSGRSSRGTRSDAAESSSGRASSRSRSERESQSTRRTRSTREPNSRGTRTLAAEVTITQSTTTSDTELRFYLNGSDPLVDAPSIGPRTAEHFHKIGITTVAEFIRLSPESAAAQIDKQRITANIIRDWQAQAVLACRIPQLRGHDAQILVACDVKDPTVLARMEPSELWASVKPFIKSAEGKRVIRGGKNPDLNEIKDWIAWAQQSRTMRAA